LVALSTGRLSPSRRELFATKVLTEDECCLRTTVLARGYVDAGPLFQERDEFYAWKSGRTPEVHLYAAPGN
jgi:hypothetical protein